MFKKNSKKAIKKTTVKEVKKEVEQEVTQETTPNLNNEEPCEIKEEIKSKENTNKKPYYHYELSFLHEDKKGELHRFHIEMKHFRLIFGTILGIFILVCCVLVFRQYRVSNKLEEALVLVDNLKDQLSDSQEEIDNLNQHVSELEESNYIMGESLNAKTESLNALVAEAEERCVPKAYPLKGTAAITEASSLVSENSVSENEGTQETTKDSVHFMAQTGTSVIATADGTVTEVNVDDQYGICIVIDHGNGYQTYYRGKGVVLIETGTKVVSGTILMQIAEDNSEFVYQITYNEEYIDPMNCMEISG